MALRLSFNLSGIDPNAPTTTGITFVLTPHIYYYYYYYYYYCYCYCYYYYYYFLFFIFSFLSELLFSGFLQFKGNFVHGQNN